VRAKEGVGKKRREVVRNKGGPSQYPEEAAALAFFRVPRIPVDYFNPQMCFSPWRLCGVAAAAETPVAAHPFGCIDALEVTLEVDEKFRVNRVC
jgi:hypothetical protein